MCEAKTEKGNKGVAHVWIKEISASEPLKKHREIILAIKSSVSTDGVTSTAET
jgi:hypothetical protein